MDNLLITRHSDGSIMCAEDKRGLLCFKIDTETLEQWIFRCSEQFRVSPSLLETPQVKR